MIKYIIPILVALLALFLNFRAKFVAEKILKHDATDDYCLNIKIVAGIICILDFVLVMILF